MQKGFAPIIILVGILLLASVGGAYYFFKIKTPTQKACTQEAKICPDGLSVGRGGPNCEFTPCSTSSPSPTLDETANWKTYTNTENHYILKYPTDWKLTEDTVQQISIVGPKKSDFILYITVRPEKLESLISELSGGIPTHEVKVEKNYKMGEVTMNKITLIQQNDEENSQPDKTSAFPHPSVRGLKNCLPPIQHVLLRS